MAESSTPDSSYSEEETEEEEQQQEETEEQKQARAMRIKDEGNTLFKAQKFQAALQTYSRAIALAPGNHTFYSNRAAAYGALNHFDKAIADCDRATAIDPTFLRAHARKATYLLKLGRTDEARSAATKITQRDPRSSLGLDLMRKIRSVDNALTLAQKQLDQKQYSGCFSTVTAALKLAPLSQPHQLLQLKALRGKGLLDQAIKVSTQMVRNGFRSNDVLSERAHVYYLQHNFEAAKKHLSEVLKNDPDHRESQQLLKRLRSLTKTKEKGNNAFKAGRLSEAIQCYTECLKFDPNLNKFNAQLHCNRAAALLKQGKYRAAESDCSAAIRLDSTYLKAYQRRAVCHEHLGDLQQAVSDLHKTRTLLTQNHQSTDAVDRKVQQLNVRIKRANRKDFYKILGVSHSFTKSELTKAKRKKALIWHPDKWANKSKAEQEKATSMMKDVNEAFGVLSDPDKRRRYDNGEDDLDGPEHGHGHGHGMHPDMFNMFFRGGMGGMGGGFRRR